MRIIIAAFIVPGLLVSGSNSPAVLDLIDAATKGDLARVSRAIDSGVDVNIVGDQGNTALISAAYAGHAEIVSFLLANGASVNQATYFYGRVDTALFAAGRGRHVNVARILLQNGADVDLVVVPSMGGAYTALLLAAWNFPPNDSEIVPVLIEYGANVNLLLTGANPYSALYVAAHYANAPVVDKLIRAGADVNLVQASFCSPLLGAARPAHLIGIDLDILHLLQIETMSLLLQAGADVHAVHSRGDTALLSAVESSCDDAVRVLITYGADVSQNTIQKGTPLMKALGIRSTRKVRMLVIAGADISDIPQDLFQEYIQPIVSPLRELVSTVQLGFAFTADPAMPREKLLTVAFLTLKNNQDTNLFKNQAFLVRFNEWEALRINMISRIIHFLAKLECGDLLFLHYVAPFLAEVELESLHRFGAVLSFLTAPLSIKTSFYHSTGKDELGKFISTILNGIVNNAVAVDLARIVDAMHAA